MTKKDIKKEIIKTSNIINKYENEYNEIDIKHYSHIYLHCMLIGLKNIIKQCK